MGRRFSLPAWMVLAVCAVFTYPARAEMDNAWAAYWPLGERVGDAAGDGLIVVDDFESYNWEAYQGTRLGETWIPDPWREWGPYFNECSEYGIVHGGRQAMAVDYNTVNPPWYEGTQREFLPAQDWTVNGCDTLVLHVRGLTTNAPAPLYLALEDATRKSSLVIHPDPQVLRSTAWLQWRVPLSGFAGVVNLGKVKWIRLGAGDPRHPVPNGAGRMYIDDIWVARSSSLPAAGAADCVYPAAGDVNVPESPVLRWSSGSTATHHDIYFGTDPNTVAAATPATAGIYRGRQVRPDTTYGPGVLDWNKTWYWRIDEVNEAEAASPWKGAVWCFTTADFLVLDDFESYSNNGEKGAPLCMTWLSRWYVGGIETILPLENPGPPYLEFAIVHTGRQAMAVDYNDVPEPWYDELERTYPFIQDWTVHGMNTLVLYVRGRATNEPEPLYLRVDDSAGKAAATVHPDPQVLLAAQWVAWKIPLSELPGVNLKKVKRLRLGTGNPRDPRPGGRGRFYVDDIRVIKATP